MLENYGSNEDAKADSESDAIVGAAGILTHGGKDASSNEQAPFVLIKPESATSKSVSNSIWVTYIGKAGVRFFLSVIGLIVYMGARTFTGIKFFFS